MIAVCYWCKTTRPPLTVVGCIETGSGPGWFTHACRPCRTNLRIVPLEDHPDDTDGRPRYEPHAVMRDEPTWITGCCWLSCRRTGLPVMPVGSARTAGTHAPLYACETCLTWPAPSR